MIKNVSFLLFKNTKLNMFENKIYKKIMHQ